MAKQVAFLRSINVGGRRVSGAQLVEIFEGLGLAKVANFLASGNLVFDARASKTLEGRIEQGLREALGYEVPTILRSADEVRAVAQTEAFGVKALAASSGKVQVSLLAKAPTKAAAASVLKLATPQDRLAIVGRELYWLPIGKMSDSQLDVIEIERRLGTQTRRTLNTMQRLSKKFLT